MGYGRARDMSELWDCHACEDEGNVVAECVVCDGTGDVLISLDGDTSVCGECGGTGRVAIPCPKCHGGMAEGVVVDNQQVTERADT